jgi:hypothetical protein
MPHFFNCPPKKIPFKSVLDTQLNKAIENYTLGHLGHGEIIL